MTNIDVPILIVGGGPVGLVLSIDLAWRGVHSMLVNTGETTALHPQGGTHNSRTMEHYRRFGIANDVRAVGSLPNDPTDAAYFTRLSGYELARLSMPSSTEKMRSMSECDPSMLSPEPIHRSSQFYVEPVLLRHAETFQETDLRFGWTLIEFHQQPDHVQSVIQNVTTGETKSVCSRWLVGCDGGQSSTRRALGIPYHGEGGEELTFMIGRMASAYIDAPEIYKVMKGSARWQYCWTVNNDARACIVALDGKGQFVVLTKLPSDIPVEEFDIVQDVRTAVGADIDVNVLSVKPWTAGNALVADRFGDGRVFLAGDSIHLFTPTGGFGMNTGIDDAVNLSWKLAAVYQGWAPDQLLNTYESERRPVAIRNTKASRKLASDVATVQVPDRLEDDTPEGARHRTELGAHLSQFTEEFASYGVQLGMRYDDSPLIVSDGTKPPPDSEIDYVPTSCPGGRAPHLWLADGQSIFDRFGKWFTLLKLGNTVANTSALEEAANALNIPLSVVQVGEFSARELYERDLVLVRPDQHVAWRGNTCPDNTEELFKHIVGHTI